MRDSHTLSKRNAAEAKVGTIVAVLLMCAALAACSSAPPPKEEVFDQRNLATEYVEFGNKYYKQAQYDQAARFYQLASEYYAAVDAREGLVTANNSLGKVRLTLGDFEGALAYYKKAEAIAAVVGKSELLLQCANNLGEMRLRKGETKDALSIFEKALSSSAGQFEQSREKAVLLHNFAAALKAADRPDEAEAEIAKAQALNLGAKRYEELASNYYLLSSLHSKRKNYGEALKAAELALEYDKKMENSLGIAQDLTALGLIMERTGQTEPAYDMYKRSFLVYRAIQYVPGARKSLELLEAAARKLNKNEEADQYLEARKLLQSK